VFLRSFEVIRYLYGKKTIVSASLYGTISLYAFTEMLPSKKKIVAPLPSNSLPDTVLPFPLSQIQAEMALSANHWRIFPEYCRQSGFANKNSI
jgi:hypothetical protein